MSQNQMTPASVKGWVEAINKQISNVMRSKIDQSNISDVKDRLCDLTVLIGNSSQAVSMAQLLRDQTIDKILEDQIYISLTPNEKKIFIQAKTAKENALLTYTQELNSGIKVYTDNLRTLISFAKSEMDNLKYLT